ncbi:MAG: metal-dependent hydrolase [Planctomycetia bacterium]|nr:metal-dependent hydrolase [Planctomycetia bacterium]
MKTTIQFLGHNAWLVRCDSARGDSARILIDPFLSTNPIAALRAEEAEADFILVSHGHADHLGDTVEIAKRTNAQVVAIAEISGWLQNQGVAHTQSMNLGGSLLLPFGRVLMTPALHSSTLPDGSSGGSSAGFLLMLNGGTNLYFACDTALFSDMRLIGDRGIHTAFLPIGDRYTMGPSDALEAVRLLRAQNAVPCHYDTWSIIRQDAGAWKAHVEAQTTTKVFVAAPGAAWELD